MRHLAIGTIPLLLACSGGDDAAIDAGQMPDAASCTHSGFSADGETAERDAELDVLFYTAVQGNTRLTIDFYFPLGAIDDSQNLTLTGEGLDTCATCVFTKRDCGALICQTSLMAQSGQLTITAMGDTGEPFSGSLNSAVFAEVDIDAATQQTTVVPGGVTWCIDSYEFSLQVTSP